MSNPYNRKSHKSSPPISSNRLPRRSRSQVDAARQICRRYGIGQAHARLIAELQGYELGGGNA